jgi:predicted nuclease of restriction endonuclease-like (RecB) superfamily
MSQKEFDAFIRLIQTSRKQALQSVNAELINLYWNVGAYLKIEMEDKKWGEKKIMALADFIQNNYPELKGFNKRGLYRMKQFYETYTDNDFLNNINKNAQNTENQIFAIVSSPMTQLDFEDIRQSLLAKISWTHHLTLMSRAKTNEERAFYLHLCVQENYTVKELERQINASFYERVVLGKVQLSATNSEMQMTVKDFFKDKYVFEFLNINDEHSEQELQKGLISEMKNFILELGKDFLFISENYRVQVGNGDFYIDLLFYHRSLQCLVAFELKTDKFKPEHLGQLNFYLEALDRDVKKANENPSIGILLCKDKDNEIVEYALSRSLSPTMVAEYTVLLPDKKLLQEKLHDLFK